MVRRVAERLGFRFGNVRFWRGHKYTLAVVGLAMSCLFAVPLLSYFYPPAIVARQTHRTVSEGLDSVLAPAFSWEAVVLSGSAMFVIGLVLVELFLSKRFWCRYLCPGGAVYSLLGAWRPVRMVCHASRCTSCGRCVEACGMGLNPMKNKMGIECDNCMACKSSCSDQALAITLTYRNKPLAQKNKTEVVSS